MVAILFEKTEEERTASSGRGCLKLKYIVSLKLVFARSHTKTGLSEERCRMGQFFA